MVFDTESESNTTILFNLDSLNRDRREVLPASIWNMGQIPESPDSIAEALVRRVNQDRLRFERGETSKGPQISRAQTHSQDQIHNPNPVAHQEIPPSATNHSDSLAGLGPSPLMNAGTCTLCSLGPIVVDLGPNSPSSVHSEPCLQTWLQFEECEDTQVVLKAPKPNSRKRFRKEIGRLGRNINHQIEAIVSILL